MKKYLILLIMAAAVFVSCGQDNLLPEDETVQQTPITFNLTANHPDATKAVKTGWEAGDAIFVFFNNVAAPKYLKMTCNGTSWASAEYDGATQTDGALGLKNGDTGTMRAVFLPFGSNATVSADGTSFVFSTTYYAYYLTATLDYTVTNNKVSGAFAMSIPDGYVQFFIEDANATDGGYTLGTDAVIPVGVASIAADGSITETSDKTYVDDMPGYAYSGGYLFSGKLNSEYHSYCRNDYESVEANAYYFSKTKAGGTDRHDYFVSGKMLTSHSAVKLPANDNVYAIGDFGMPNNGKWVPVGNGIYCQLRYIANPGTSYEIEESLGIWHTCNWNCTTPEQLGVFYYFDAANGLQGAKLPNKRMFESLLNNCSLTWLTIHGQPGLVFCALKGFLFLPAQDETNGSYWSSDEYDSDRALGLYIESFPYGIVGVHKKTREFPVRNIKSL